MRYSLGALRQVNESGVQIGASTAIVVPDDTDDIRTIAHLAKDATDIFPHLRKVKLVRSWVALRVMSDLSAPSKYPYESFDTCRNVGDATPALARILARDYLADRSIADEVKQALITSRADACVCKVDTGCTVTISEQGEA